jgi:outer membrane protein
MKILKQTLKETKANALPFLQLNTGYTFMRNQSEAGFVFLNRQNGINASLVAGWTIFNGGRNNKLTKEREINLLNQKYVSEQTLQSINSQVFVQTKTYLLSQEMMQLENQNLKDAFELYQIAVERYNTGKSNFIVTLEMQRRYEDAQMRYTNALFNSKIAEIELLKVSGDLVK